MRPADNSDEAIWKTKAKSNPYNRRNSLKSAAVTDVGKQREINQDYIYRNDEAVGILPNLYIVADGMGGHKAGDFASRLAVDEFIRCVKQSDGRTIIGTIEAAISVINGIVYERSKEDESLDGMGTTFVGTVVNGNSAVVFNVGDSRMYRFPEDGNFVQISEDHSLVESMVKNGEIDRREAVHHPKKNVITRAIGVEESVTPDFFEIDLSPGDILLLCSDGLTNMVDEEKISDILKKKEISLEERAKMLVELANEKGGKDNISTILIEI